MKTQIKRRSSTTQSLETDRATVGSGLGSIIKGSGESFWKDFFKSSIQEIPKQLSPFGAVKETGKKVEGGNLIEGETTELLKKQQVEEIVQARTHLEYFRREVDTTEVLLRKDEEQARARVEELKAEIAKLIKEVKELQSEFRTVAREVVTEKTPHHAGTYHQNFFEWIMIQIRVARTRIEEGTNWLRVFSSKKKQKQYWQMFKKHGTTFGLSNERTTATQTG